MSDSVVVRADRATVYRALLDRDVAGEPGGTEVEMRFDGLPDAVPRADKEAGTRMSLEKLARLVG